jgi:glycosyltransferase involved in cell wall biosynthesis
MDVLLIHQAFAGPNDPGGTRHFELGRRLVERGHRLTVIASQINYLTGQPVGNNCDQSTEENYEGVRVLRSFTYRCLHRSFVWRVISFLSFMLSSTWSGLRAGPVDVVMGTTPPIFQAVSAWLIAAIRRRPFLLEVRDLWPEFAIAMSVLTNPVLIRLSRMLEGFLYGRATHIVVNSPAYREYLIAKGIPTEKISLISNGVDPAMFDPAARADQIREDWGARNKFVVIYAGALGPANDIRTLLRAAERLRHVEDVRFILVGDGKERHDLELEARTLRLANVTFLGTRPKAEMNDILAASDACVAILKDLPAFRSTYPNKVFDYMAAGRPTILAIDGVIREVVEAARGGIFVQPGDDCGLAAAVELLRSDPLRAASMGTAARAYVVKHFNRSDQAEDFVRLIQKLPL